MLFYRLRRCSCCCSCRRWTNLEIGCLILSWYRISNVQIASQTRNMAPMNRPSTRRKSTFYYLSNGAIWISWVNINWKYFKPNFNIPSWSWNIVRRLWLTTNLKWYIKKARLKQSRKGLQASPWPYHRACTTTKLVLPLGLYYHCACTTIRLILS